MNSIKFQDKGNFKARWTANRRGIWLPLAGLILATLACSRADVPPPGGIGSGGLPSPTSQISPSAVPTEIILPLIPSATDTPDRPEPLASPTFPATPTTMSMDEPELLLYEAQPGDSVHSVAVRFGILPEEVESPDPLPVNPGLIDPGQLLLIPRRLIDIGSDERLIPDSELIFSPHASDFNTVEFAAAQGGYLQKYRQIVGTRWLSGAEIVERVALNNSMNPRLLLAMVEYIAGWVTDPTVPGGDAFNYPMGNVDDQIPGLYRQLTWLANELGNGYYGWRAGTLTEVRFWNTGSLRLAPDLNAGTVAIQHFFSIGHTQQVWEAAISPEGFLRVYKDLFGDPWAYEYPLFEPGVEQPDLILPFELGKVWAYTGGPHGAWERESAWAALDFAPASSVSGCVVSEEWVVAAAPGIVVRSENGAVVLDLDGDGREHSGWSLLYLHVDHKDRVQVGSLLDEGDRIGHPSCEGGIATGTHIHIARMYNGEWILADGPIPFNLDGWVARAGSKPYQGALVKDGQEVLACPCASQETLITR
ncbi:MAG: hypothetical protein KAS80_03170 [Anaerolineales bacterium]|nr:hypothetical protein [Anaerolineales bacterium]